MPDPIQLLREQHKEVLNLFDQFKKANNAEQRKGIVDNASVKLMMHTQLEEDSFYPTIRSEGEEAKETIDEALEEHHVVKMLISELADMKPDYPRYGAKFMVMAENVRHHIEEEESQVFSTAKKMGNDRLMRLGDEMSQRWQKIEQEVMKSRGRRAA
jgi:hemerythrin-like domain-containing protein